MDPHSDIAIHTHHLPHWQQGSVFYFVTYRLADSLPASKLAEWQSHKEAWMRHHPQPWDERTEAEFHQTFSRQIDEWLDAGHGSSLLRDPAMAQIVADAFLHFHGQRYDLDAFVVMPNHVHVLFQLRAGELLEKVIHSWKSFTSKQIVKTTGLKGVVWMEDYWDRIIRNERHLDAVREYIRGNIGKGGGLFWQRNAGVSPANGRDGGQISRPTGPRPPF